MDILNVVGYNGPYAMLLYGIHLLLEKRKMLFYFIVGILLNSVLNLVLKGLFKQPRPEYDTDKIKESINSNLLRYALGYDIYGMPSGHAQNALYITTFLYLVTRNLTVGTCLLLFSLVIILQRVVFNKHTIFQTFIGSVVGSFFAYVVYIVARSTII